MAGNKRVAPYAILDRWKASWQRVHKAWIIPVAIVALLLLLPLGVILSGIFEPATPTWTHLKSTVLWNYTANSIFLMLGCGVLTAIIGVTLAWIVSMYDFPGRKFFRWALLLPLAFPTYIAAFEFAGIFDYSGPYHLVLRYVGLEDVPHIQIVNHAGLITILSLVLYPYTFAACRVAFESRYGNYIETARSLGMSTTKVFFKVMLPMARPAIYGGSFLVMMEVLNDYGAMKYFGINTFTTGIFSAWFSMGDLTSALRLASILLFFALALSWGQGYTEKKFKTTESAKSKRSVPLKISQSKQWAFTVLCSFIFTVAFILPITYILWQLGMLKDPFGQPEWLSITLNSLLMAASATVLTVLFVVVMQFVRLVDQSDIMKYLGRSVAVGYAVPGAIIAVGVLAVSGTIDQWIDQNWLVGSFFMLIFAYVLRFSGVAFQPIQVEIAKRSGHMIRAAQSLGTNLRKVFSHVYLPLSKKGLITACMLVFVDVLKELPLTLILRPFNFETLATKAFEYASDEMLMKAALPSLLIVLVGLVPVYMLHKSLDHA